MDFDQYISTSIAEQFPAFYQAEGPVFIVFVKAYYEWMEQQGYVLNASRNLLNYKDVDESIDQFTANFKNEFLQNFPSITSVDRRILVKRIKDFYHAKGSRQGMQLLFRLLFDDDIEVYDPGKDILKASDGIWTIPRYIEVENNSRSRSFIGQQITGSISGATAFVESVHLKIINQRLIDILSLSNIKGDFLYNEVVTNDGNLYNAPRIVGSLTAINITDGGANNKIGDVFDVHTSTNGIKGKVRVVSVIDGTGRVTFKLLDGGTGYTNSASQVHVSNTILNTDNRTNSEGILHYNTLDTVCQPLINVYYTVSTPSNPNTQALYYTTITGYASNGSAVGTGLIVATPSGSNSFVFNTISGDFTLATSINTPGNTIQYTGWTNTDVSIYGTVTGSNGSAVGLHDITRSFYGNGAVIISSSNLVANVTSISTGSGANFEIGSLSNTESVYLYTDRLNGTNFFGVPYMDMLIDGTNSNSTVIGDYGFSGIIAAGYNDIIGQALNSNTFTVGTIASLSAINPGSNYNANPFVLIRNNYIAGYDRRNLILEITNKTGLFANGDTLNQTISLSSAVVTYNANTGAFTTGEGVTQSNGISNAYATINSINSTAMVLKDLSGTFGSNTNGYNLIVGLSGGSSANAVTVSNSTIAVLSKGVIVGLPNSSIIEVRRSTFDVSYKAGSNVSSSSGGTAKILSVTQNQNSAAMGNNAVVSANVTTARGIATSLQVLSSGFGHMPGDIIELTNANNAFAITGTANVYNQGIAEGYWVDTKGMLNSDKYIIDGNYYQNYSYEIQSRLSLDKYVDILKKLAHVEGTRLFGKVLIGLNTVQNITPLSGSSVIEFS